MSDINKNKSALSIPIMFQKVDEFVCEDKRFTKVKIWLMHLGENANGSVFEKEVVDKALDTLQYVPIVGFIEKNETGEEDFSDHRYIITKDKKGVRRVYQGHAYGVVLSSADNNVHYEERLCDDGEIKTFVVCDGILWNMFEDSFDIMKRDLIKGHSMELADGELGTYDGYEDENGLFHFTEFSFRAACILGDAYAPAMVNSTVEVQFASKNFTMYDFVKGLQNELNNEYTNFTKMVNKKSNQGGIETMQNTDFTQTVLQQFEDISTMVREYESVRDRWGEEIPRYYVVDIQENEVIVVDRESGYRYFAFAFTIEGDKPVIDFTSGKRKKLCYEDYIEGDEVINKGFDFGKHIAEVEEVAFGKVDEANKKTEAAEQDKATVEADYAQIKADYDDIKPKYDAYVVADEQRKADELNSQKEAKFAEYEDTLSDNPDFVALKTRKDELSVDEIEKECAVLYVKVNRAKVNFSKNNSTSVTVGIIEDDNISNGYVSTKYGIIPVRQ